MTASSRPADPGPADTGARDAPPLETGSGEGAQTALQRLKELERLNPDRPQQPQQ